MRWLRDRTDACGRKKYLVGKSYCLLLLTGFRHSRRDFGRALWRALYTPPTGLHASGCTLDDLMSSAGDEVGDPSDWTGESRWVAALDSSLRCELCYDVFVAPVSLRACGHAFCSACIRTHINQPQAKGQFCPKCRQPKAYDSELVLQPALEVAAHVWRANRACLREVFDRETRYTDTIAQLNERIRALEAGIQTQENVRTHAEYELEADLPRTLPLPPDEIQEDLFDRSSEPVEGAELGLQFPPSSQVELAALRDRREQKLKPSPLTRGRKRTRSRSPSSDIEVLSVSPPPRKVPATRSPARNDRLQGMCLRRTDIQRTNSLGAAQSRVDCPICGYDFTLEALNRHLDSGQCEPGREPSRRERGLPTISPPTRGSAEGESRTRSTDEGARPRTRAATAAAAKSGVMAFFGGGTPVVDKALDPAAKRLVRPHYHGQREKDLRKLLKDAGLPVVGSRERMIERHTQWINLWNANLDASPSLRKSTAQLRSQLREWESKVLDNATRTLPSAGEHPVASSSSSDAWVTAHRDQFRELVRAARASAMRDRQQLQTASKNAPLPPPTGGVDKESVAPPDEEQVLS